MPHNNSVKRPIYFQPLRLRNPIHCWEPAPRMSYCLLLPPAEWRGRVHSSSTVDTQKKTLEESSPLPYVWHITFHCETTDSVYTHQLVVAGASHKYQRWTAAAKNDPATPHICFGCRLLTEIHSTTLGRCSGPTITTQEILLSVTKKSIQIHFYSSTKSIGELIS